MAIVKEKVKPEREKNNRAVYRERWWHYGEKRPDLYATIAGMKRVLGVPLVTHHISFAFESADIVFAHRLAVFPFCANSAFALLQSSFHEPWARTYSSSLETRINYSPPDCFETFPFPEFRAPLEAIGERYYQHRQTIMQTRQEGLTKTYNRFHNPADTSPDIAELRRLHVAMDEAVTAAYGWQDMIGGAGSENRGAEEQAFPAPRTPPPA